MCYMYAGHIRRVWKIFIKILSEKYHEMVAQKS